MRASSLGSSRPVEREDTAREQLGELPVGAVDTLDEVVVLALDPVALPPVRPRRLGGSDEQQHGAVGEQASGRRRLSSSTRSTPRPRAMPWYASEESM